MSLAARKIRLVMMLRQSGITDTSVLAAIERIPREAFVPRPFLDLHEAQNPAQRSPQHPFVRCLNQAAFDGSEERFRIAR